MTVTITMPVEATEEDHQAILKGLVAFNDATAGPSGYENIAFPLKDEAGVTVGGLWGTISYDWLFVGLLFVPEALRGQDLGRRLIGEAERLAASRGLVGVWLDTHGFQAPGFYEGLGYEQFGELPDYPRGSRRVFFRKLLG